jgi:hypothetical protein
VQQRKTARGVSSADSGVISGLQVHSIYSARRLIPEKVLHCPCVLRERSDQTQSYGAPLVNDSVAPGIHSQS